MENIIVKSHKKVIWLSLLQGYAILLVIIGHVALNFKFVDTEHPAVNIIFNIIYGFHMPLFIFISGFLFYYTKIFKEISYKTMMKDKFKRLCVPMLFFTIITCVLKTLAASFVLHPVHYTWKYFLDVFLFYKETPFAITWFLIALLVLMSLYPLYVFVLKKKYLEVMFLFFTLILSYIGIDTMYFQLNNVAFLLLFFFSGILVAKYKMHRFLVLKKSFIFLSICFISINMLVQVKLLDFIFEPQILAFIGIMFSFSLCMNLSKHFPFLFLSFRNYTYQIFLIGIYFQLLIRYLYIAHPHLLPYWIFYVISILLGLYMPVLISKCVEKLLEEIRYVCHFEK